MREAKEGITQPKNHSILRAHILPLLFTFLVCLLSIQPSRTQAQSLVNAPEEVLRNLSTTQLLRLYDSTHEDVNRVKVLVTIGETITSKRGEFTIDLDSARHYLNQALAVNKKVRSKQWEYNTLIELGNLYYEYENKTDSALLYYNMSIAIARRDKDTLNEASAWMNMSFHTPIYKAGLVNKKLEYTTNAYLLFKAMKRESDANEMLKNIADCHFNMAQYDLAEKELNQVLNTYKALGNKKLHFTYDLLSAVNRMKGDLPKALSYAIMAGNSMEATKDTIQAGYFYRRMADAYYDIGNIAESLVYYRKSFEAFKYSNTSMLYPSLTALADVMLKQGQAAEANMLINSTLERFPVSPNDHVAVTGLQGDCYKAMKQYTLAEKYYLQALDPSNNNENAYNLYYSLSEVYIAEKKYTAADYYLRQLLATDKIKYLALSRVRDVHLLLFKVDSATGNPSAAIDEYLQYTHLKDSLLNEETANQVATLQVRYQTREQEKDNQILRKQSQLQQKEIHEANQARKFVIAAIALLLLIIVLLYNRYKIKQKSNLQLQTQQQVIQQAYHALELSLTQKNKLLSEKEWLLKEIHHRVKNNLQLVMSLLNTQTHYLQNDVALMAINESKHRLRSISLIHQKLYQSDVMATVDLKVYILQLVEFLRESYENDRIHFIVEPDAVNADVSVAVPLGLIINEALTNIFKYAYPAPARGTVHVTLQHHPNQLLLSITDDGAGLPKDFDIERNSSMGFTLLQGLSTQLDGQLSITSTKGVSITLSFPFPNRLSALQEEAVASMS